MLNIDVKFGLNTLVDIIVTPSTEKKIFISVEGIIGAGKSTLLDYIKELFLYQDDIRIVPEPVELWQNLNNIDYLNNFYQNPNEQRFKFEILTLFSRIAKEKETTPQKINFIERHIKLENQFIKDLSDEDFFVYEYVYKTMLKIRDIPLHGVIWLCINPETALKNIKKRNRNGEETITLDQLSKMHVDMRKYIGNYCLVNQIPLLEINMDYFFDQSKPRFTENYIKKEISHFINLLK